MSVNREIELKGSISTEYLDRIKDLPAIKKRAVGRARSRKLTTVYFDTPESALRQQGLSLRVRKIGSAYVQCVKQAHKKFGGILVRTEWEGPVPSQGPAVSVIENKKLRRRIRAAGIKRLKPIFSTEFRRSSRALEFDDGSRATLDIDVGEIIADGRSDPICEFELELESGAPENLFELASEIGKAIPFRISSLSKAARGYALLTRKDPQPQKSNKLAFAKDATVEHVLTDLVQHCLDKLQANELVVLKTEEPEGVHQMRIALRRLRAALQLFKPALPADQYCWITTEAKWLNDALSAPRGWDVFADEIVAPLAQLYGKDQGFDELLIAVEQARRHSHQQARATIDSERYTDFLLRLSAWLSAKAWREQPVSEQTTRLLDPVRIHSADLLQKRDKLVRRQGKEIKGLSADGLHKLRLSIKRLRYAADFFEELYPKKSAKSYKKRLARLQNALGYLRDVGSADTLIHTLAENSKDQAAACAYAGGLIVGWHRSVSLNTKKQLHRDMAAFLRTEPFWNND